MYFAHQYIQKLPATEAQQMIAQYDPLQIQQMLRTIEDLETRIIKLESQNSSVSASEGSLLFKVGDASLLMKKDGEVTIRGNDITLSGSGRVNIKAARDLTLKGAKIVEN